MANSFLDHVWKIDTAFTTGSPGTDKSGDVVSAIVDKVQVEVVRWVVTAAGVATDNVQIADKDGNVVWEAVNESGAAQFEVESAAPLTINGLQVPVIDRGTLYLYHDVNRS